MINTIQHRSTYTDKVEW